MMNTNEVLLTWALGLVGLFALLMLGACASPVDPLEAWEPSPFGDPEFVILDLPAAQAQAACEVVGRFKAPQGMRVLGCVNKIGPMKSGEACLIIMNGQLFRPHYEKILRHEKAHCRGWEHGQPVPEGDIG